MTGVKGVPRQRRFFSLTTSTMFILSTMLIGVTLQIPNATAAALTHDVGNLDIETLTDFGRILEAMYWKGIPQTTDDPGTQIGFIGLVIDQDNYDHTIGSEQVADPYLTAPYFAKDDLDTVDDITWLIDDGTTQKSAGSFQNTGAGTGDPNDIHIEQKAWTVLNKDWAILQWRLINLKVVPITGVCIGLELPLSQVGTNYGVGWDSGDDIDGYDSVNNVYWVQDDGGTTIGFASAISSDPITHYYSQDYHAEYENVNDPFDPDPKYYKNFYANDAWLYNRLHAPNAVEGLTPGNRSSTVGWDGFNIDVGSFKTVTLVIAINNTYDNMITALKDAQYYYQNVATSFRITEFSDISSGTQKIEVYNYGRPATDLYTAGYRLSVDGGTTFLTGDNWDKKPLITYEYGVFTLNPGENIGPEGDTIGLYRDVGGGNYVLIDEVSYGQEGVAPDPLSGESVARRYDTDSASYASEWLRNASTGPTWGSQNDVMEIDTSPSIILNEVMFNPSVANGGYLVIINRHPVSSVNVRGYRIVCDTEYRLPDDFDIWLDSSNMLIIRYLDDPPSTSTLFNNMDSTGDNVYIYDRDGHLLDMVGWNTPHLQGMSVRRIPDGIGTYQGHDDITSVAAGWFFNTPLEVLITEISDSGSVTSQIEVYNPWYSPINFDNGFTFQSTSGSLSGSWSIPIADNGEHAVFDVTTSNGLHPEGDTLTLYQNGALIEEISYGQNGIVPDPLVDESVQRIFESGNYTDDWRRNLTSGPNFGAHNNVVTINFKSTLLLNEVMFNPTVQKDGFIELYLNFSGENISGYKIVGDSEFIIPDGTVLNGDDQFFYLRQEMDPSFFAALNPSGDNVYLYDDYGNFLDMAGWSSSHTKGKTMCRVPNGNGTRDGFDDTSSIAAGWVFDCLPSLQLLKVSARQTHVYGDFGDVVYFNLTITNKQWVDDTALIFNSTLNGYPIVILDETGTFIITKIFVPAESSVNIKIKAILPSTIPFIGRDNITIEIQSENNTQIRDSIIIHVSVFPFIWPEKYASPQQIYLAGTGHDETSTITLNLTGMGSAIEFMRPQEVIFCVDTSGSMSYEAINLIRSGLFGYVDRMREDDKGAVVVFNTGAWLMNPLTDNHMQLKNDIFNIPGPSGSTYMGEALRIAINELLLNGNKSNIQVIILLTDGNWNGFVNPLSEANRAVDNNITIFTIGLEPAPGHEPLDEFTLREIADKTGGQYFYADDPSVIPEIYMIIAAYIGNLAGRDTDITDAKPMVRDVLPPWIILVDGSFSIPPDMNYVNDKGYRILEWNISSIAIGESWEVTFQVKSMVLGKIFANDVGNSRVYYVDYFDMEIFKLFPECLLNVLPPPPLPPKLYIDILPNKDDIFLYWDEPLSLGTHHYLIYRASSPTGFDFSSPWVDTNNTLANGIDPVDRLIIPSRRSWNHTGAADPTDKTEWSEQWYYCIRTVNYLGEISHTSRTVGKWTKNFCNENATFSLPLEPLKIEDTEFYAQDMDARFVKWMDPVDHEWVQHDLGEIGDNTYLELGKGYEVSFVTVDKKYTFLGMPGAMIRYKTCSFVGFDYNSNAKTLSAQVDPVTGDVTLTWSQPSGMDYDDQYYIYYSPSRDGFHGIEGSDFFLLATVPFSAQRMAVHSGAALPGNQYYYMVIPVNENNVKGSGTYSIGVWTSKYSAEYDTIGIPLILESYPTADWYCDNIVFENNKTVGINYYIELEQRWSWHSTRMPAGAYDPTLIMTEGYQISTSGITRFTFIGR